ncbi:vWA domain-containing protein [Oscillibacter ruminantium]|uniref:vWA domain-containing protein n=1 Tax=Oscillibacter ruminantium TaxID=1263547 RepID=UPI0002E13E43
MPLVGSGKAMFTGFFYALRRYGLDVSLNEWLTLMEALTLGLHGSQLTDFYYLARCILVKSEADFDRFDLAFAEYFRDVESVQELPDEFLEWLAKAAPQRDFDRDEVDARFGGGLDLEELKKMLAQRLSEQTERHDGGGKWVGTGGTSPFGHGGYNPAGIRIGGPGRQKSAVQVAAERDYRDFRQDAALELRQFQMAFRRLRNLTVKGDGPKDELQLDETIQATCDNGGFLKLAFDRPRKNDVRLLVLFDSGGSMWSYSHLCSRLFHAVHEASHFKELKTFYFHNCVYDDLFTTPECWYQDSADTKGVLQGLNSSWKILFVGDGAMAPSELLSRGGCLDYYRSNSDPGLAWLRRFAAKSAHVAWLNPIPQERWAYTWGNYTIGLIGREMPMFPLTIDGLDDALRHLMAPR